MRGTSRQETGAGRAAVWARRFLPFLGIGLVAVAVLIWAVLFVQRGAHLELKGSIQKVRTLGLPDNSTIIVLDFRLVNPADYPFVVREVALTLETAGGETIEGAIVSETDARKLFEYYPILGQKFNDTLAMRTRIAPRESIDRMIAARLELPEERVERRKGLRLRIEDVDGAVSEIREGA